MPAYLVTPLSFRYRPDERLSSTGVPELAEFAIHACPPEIDDGRDVIRVREDLAPLDLSADAPLVVEMPDEIALWRKAHRSVVLYVPREIEAATVLVDRIRAAVAALSAERP